MLTTWHVLCQWYPYFYILIMCCSELNVSTFEEAFDLQILLDQRLGFDFIGYHGYAKRRYYELMQCTWIIFCSSFDSYCITIFFWSWEFSTQVAFFTFNILYIVGSFFCRWTADVSELCADSDKRNESMTPPHSDTVNSTCSWRGYRKEHESFWWNGCLCLLMRSFSWKEIPVF